MADYFFETQWHEWILSSKNGAYALGTGNLINQRKYNGLLVSSNELFQRHMLVSSIEEEMEMGGESCFLDSSNYSNCVFPEGFLHLVKCWFRPYPVFLYSAVPHSDHILVKKEIMMDEDTSTVLIKYTNLSNSKLHFRLRPKFALRNHHYLNEAGIWDRVAVQTELNSANELSDINFSVKRGDNKVEAYGWMQHGFGFTERKLYQNIYYPWDAGRGYPCREDLIAPFGLEFDLKINEANYLLFSDAPITDSIIMIDNIEKRYKKLPSPADIPTKRKKGEVEESILSTIDFTDTNIFNHPDYMKILEFSLRDFMANNDIIAGFPWFGCWGRDTMISLDGIQRLPKGALIAYDILMKYAEQIKDGLIPNMCSESQQEQNYVSIDATLWFIVRLYEVCSDLTANFAEPKKTKITRLKDAIRLVESMFEALLERPHHEFFLRTDGLLELTELFAGATWMDAKVADRPVTPRNGAPVEINALLFNALCAYEKMVEEYNAISPDRDNQLTNQTYMEACSCIKEAFAKFWIGDFLADRLIGDEPVKEYRPNAIIATSLPFSNKLLSQDKLQQVYETAHIELFTLYGLRSLSPRDPRFHKKYTGGIEERDRAYHQGTVWAWLLLPLAKTWLIAFPNKPSQETASHIAYLIQKLRNGYMRGHIASVAEVWDGDKPHFPKGCPAQAWSVAALYSIENILLDLQGR